MWHYGKHFGYKWIHFDFHWWAPSMVIVLTSMAILDFNWSIYDSPGPHNFLSLVVLCMGNKFWLQLVRFQNQELTFSICSRDVFSSIFGPLGLMPIFKINCGLLADIHYAVSYIIFSKLKSIPKLLIIFQMMEKQSELKL